MGALFGQLGLVAELGHLIEMMQPGESRFFSCPSEGCFAAVAGACGACGTPWAWCGCGAHSFDCSCGSNTEGTPRPPSEGAEVRCRALEAAIRAHRARCWGSGEVGSEADRHLYALIDAMGAEGAAEADDRGDPEER